MKKIKVFIVLMLCIVLAGTVFAVPQNEKVSTSQKTVLVDRNGDTKIDGVDIYDASGKVVKRGYDTNGDMVIDKWETYNENTGMPVVVESDKSFELR